MKHKKYQKIINAGTVPKSTRKIIETEMISIPLTHIHTRDRSLSWLVLVQTLQ